MKIDRDEIAKILTEKKATNRCHRCNSNQFNVLKAIHIWFYKTILEKTL